jgi:hypothetical protein
LYAKIAAALIETCDYVSTSKSGTKTVDASYYAMVLEKRLLLVKLAGSPAGTEPLPSQTGWLADINADENKKIIQELETEEPAIRGLFLPFKLETGDFRTNGLFGLVIGRVALLLCFWGIGTVIRRSADPASHPVLRALARFGPVDYGVSRSPWAVIGYSRELETAWNKDRTGFIETVLRRKAGGATG